MISLTSYQIFIINWKRILHKMNKKLNINDGHTYVRKTVIESTRRNAQAYNQRLLWYDFQPRGLVCS